MTAAWRSRVRPTTSRAAFARTQFAMTAIARAAIAGAAFAVAMVSGLASPAPTPALAAPVVSLAGTSRAFSPNGDGRSDRLVIRLRLWRSARVTLAVYDPSGRRVRTLSSSRLLRAGRRTYYWDGRYAGTVRTDGYYKVQATAAVGGRRYTVRSYPYLDRAAPLVKSAGILAPTLFAGGGKAIKVPYRADDACRAFRLYLSVYDDDGRRVAFKTKPLGGRVGYVPWDGRDSRGAYLPPGPYKARVTAQDWAGNRGTGQHYHFSVFAPTTVWGTVRDAGGRPVRDAAVAVAGTTIRVRTNRYGRFYARNCPLGRRTVIVTKSGLPRTTVAVSVTYGTRSLAIIMGKSSSLASASKRGAAADDITISGRFFYRNKQDTDWLPMANVRLKLLDHVDVWLTSWDREIKTGSTDANGAFSITYDSTSWDEGGRYDVKVAAYAEDKNSELAEVCKGLIYEPYKVESSRRDDLDEDVTDLWVCAVGDNREAWHILDQVRSAHDYWMLKTGSHRPFISIYYPTSLDSNGSYVEHFDWINIDDEAGWSFNTPRHEYFHALQKSAYYVAPSSNAYHAYNNRHDAFYYKGRWYTYQGDVDYADAGFEGETTGWNALREGWAEFGAAASLGNDRGFECDFAYPAKDDNRVINSVARVLWDLIDDDGSQLSYTWDATPGTLGPRLTTPWGLGDDDPLVGGFPADRRGDMIEKLWETMLSKRPATASELRSGMRSRYGDDELDHRALDAVFYKLGVGSGVTENVPVVQDVAVTGNQQPDGSYRGLLTLWARVTDADTMGDADGPAGTTWDMNHMRVRFDVSGETTTGAPAFARTHLALPVARSATAPPGKSGTGWFRADWSTTASSTVRIHPYESVPGYEMFTRSDRDKCVIKGRVARVFAHAVAFDHLAQGERASTPFTVDNNPGAFGDAGYAEEKPDRITWDWTENHSSITTNGTFELRFQPSTIAPGIIAMESLGYLNYMGGQAATMPIMQLSLNSNGTVTYGINEYDGGGPGFGTWHFITGAATLEAGRWYHLVGQYGTLGMKLYVNGKLDASNPYTGWPQADWSDATLWGGWWAIGDCQSVYGDRTAFGGYDEVRVSRRQRYPADFTPPSGPFTTDADALLLDHLDGATAGGNRGFRFGPGG